MDVLVSNVDVYWHGFRNTIVICVCSALIAFIVGVPIGVLRIVPMRLHRVIGTSFVWFIRNIPATVHLFFFILVAPTFGLRLPFLWLAVCALGVYYSAYVAEALRAGTEAISKGHAEAAKALGLTLSQTLRKIALPVAFRNSVPPLINTLISMIKASAIAGVFGVQETLWAMKSLVNYHGDKTLEIMAAAAVLYIVLTIPLGIIARRVERRVGFRSI